MLLNHTLLSYPKSQQKQVPRSEPSQHMRHTTEQELVVGGNGPQLSQQLAVEVLQAVPFIHNYVVPVVARQVL